MSRRSVFNSYIMRDGDDRGFSAIEIVIALIFFALMAVPLYAIVLDFGNMGTEEDKTKVIRVALAEHYRVFGYLPCPADIDAGSTDAAFDVSDCGAAISHANPNGVVYVGALPIQDLRISMGCEDAAGPLPDNVSDVIRNKIKRVKSVIEGTSDDVFKIKGGKCITRGHILDEHNTKYIYVVSQDATALTTMDIYDPSVGAVRIVDQNGVSVTRDDQIYAIISMGPDRKGGVDSDGKRVGENCGADAAALDNENCDYRTDGIFRSMPFAQGDGSLKYDDMVDFSLAGGLQEDNLWQWSEDAPASATRNIHFSADSRILLDDVQFASGAVSFISNDDKLVVGKGNVRIQSSGGMGGTLEVKAVGSQGGNVESENVRGATDIIAEEAVVSPSFCYDPPLFPTSSANCD